MAVETRVLDIPSLRRDLNLPAGRVVLCKGGFGSERPLDLLLGAVPFVTQVCMPVQFVVLGDKPDSSVDPAVRFTGPVSTADSERFASACDVGLYLTRSVGSSLPSFSVEEIFDFLRAGKPIVVASDNADAVCFAQVNNIGLASRLTGDETVDLAALIKNLTVMLLDDKARQRRAMCSRELGRELTRTSRGGVLDVVRATLRRAASL